MSVPTMFGILKKTYCDRIIQRLSAIDCTALFELYELNSSIRVLKEKRMKYTLKKKIDEFSPETLY